MSDNVIRIENVSKEYRLGMIGGGTLRGDLQSWWARMRGQEDSNTRIGAKPLTNEKFWALKDINIEVKQGDTFGIIGGNGAGKSTLLKLLARVTAPTTGNISFKGRIASMLEVGTGFHPELSGRENVYLNGTILGMTKAEVDMKFDEIVAFSEVEQFIDTPVKRYSSGMYVKLAFAVAAHLDPEILVVDEVLAVGDMKFQQKCLGKMGDVAAGGRTVLYVSHNMRTVEQLCNRAIVLDHGQIKYDGETNEAISIYLEQNSEKLVYNDLTIAEHNPDSNGFADLLSVELIGKDNCTYGYNDKISFALSWRANIDIKGVMLRAIVLYANDMPLGFCASPPFCDAAAGKIYSSKFEMDTRYLAPNQYTIYLSLSVINEYGTILKLDAVNRAFNFEIIQRTGDFQNMTWNARYWGHVVFPEIKCESIELAGVVL